MKRYRAIYLVTCSWAYDSKSIRVIESDSFEHAFHKAVDLKNDFNSDYKIELIALEEDK